MSVIGTGLKDELVGLYDVSWLSLGEELSHSEQELRT